MFEFEFLQAIEDYTKVFRYFELPVILCDTKFRIYWINNVVRNYQNIFQDTASLHNALGVYDLEILSQRVDQEGGKAIAGMIPFNNLRFNLTPIYHKESYIGIIIMISQPENVPSAEKLENISTASSVFANDVRDTISGIFNSLDAIALKADLLQGEWVKPHLSSIAFDSYQVLRISNNVLLFTKYRNLESELALSSYNIMDWFNKIAHPLKVIGADMGIPIHFEIQDTDAYLTVDSRKFEAAFFNVLHNALYYTRPGNEITISAKALEDVVEIIIQDQGLGIPQTLLPRIFEPYFSHMPPGYPPNLGLGLTIARLVFSSHKGTITATSQEGVGTQVRIALPYPGISTSLQLSQGDQNYSLQDRFSPMYVGLTSAKHSPFSYIEKP